MRFPLIAFSLVLSFCLPLPVASTPAPTSFASLAAIDGEVVLSGDLQFGAIPEEFLSTDGISYDSPDELAELLGRRGRLTLTNARLELPLRESWHLTADELRLTDTKLWTSGSELHIYVRRLIVDDRSEILSYKNVPIGSSGGKWQQCINTCVIKVIEPDQGAFGGSLFIHVLDEIVGLPRITLAGGRGGKGATGNIGSVGATGKGGKDARNGPLGTCERGPGKGGKGGTGGKGGSGFKGGVGGSGGRLLIEYLNGGVQDGILTYFSAPGGAGGEGGDGGPGGPGGQGGRGGANAGNCTPQQNPDLNRGAQGPQGPRGDRGPTGPKGPAGRAEIRSLP